MIRPQQRSASEMTEIAGRRGLAAGPVAAGMLLLVTPLGLCAQDAQAPPPAENWTLAAESAPSGSSQKSALPDPAAVCAFGDQGTVDARKAPAWWLSQPAEVEKFLRSLPGTEVFELGRSAGNRK